jgi:hypothetical protein
MHRISTSEIYEAIERLRREKQDGRAELARLALITSDDDHVEPSESLPEPAETTIRRALQVGAGVIVLLALWFG